MQSLYNKQDIIKTFLEEPSSSKYIALCVTETWLTPAKSNIINFQGYHLAASYNRKNRTGGGVCIIIKDNIEYIERKDIECLTIEYVVEVCAIELVKLDILLITVYWNGSGFDIFMNQFKKILDYIQMKFYKKKIIIGGDFNTNILQNTKESKSLLNLMLEYNFQQHIKVPTRITKNSSTCLDLIFTNFINNVSSSVQEFGFSDHNGTIVHLENTNVLQINSKSTFWYIHKRIYNNKNINKFKTNLQKIDWEKYILQNKNINDNYNTLNCILYDILEYCIPKKRIKINYSNKKSWLTRGIKISCKNKRLLKIHATYSKNKILLSHYKLYEKNLKNIIKKAKKLHYINKMEKSNNKVKCMWQIIKEYTNKCTNTVKQNIKLNIHNILTDNPKTVTNAFNSTFASTGHDNSGGTSRAPSPRGRRVLCPTQNSFYLRPVELHEVKLLIKNLKNKHSSGIDELPSTLIKECANELAIPLTMLINQSFSEGIFPDMLKKAIIKPKFKKGEKTNPANYRPIALLPAISKIFEKAMCVRLYSFCEKYNIFDDSQNGFRKNRSTILASFKYVSKILDIINSKKYAVGIFFDMTKAYEKVKFNILLDKLYGIGVRGIAHKWFASYLHNREQYVDIEHINAISREIQTVRSDAQPMKNSIPQGSVLGCLLFIIYINDLPKIVDEPCVMFADDFSLLMSVNNDTDLNKKIHNSIYKIEKWMNDHNLEINYSKTKIMQFKPHQKKELKIKFSYNKFKIDCMPTYTLLGIVIDTNINWKSHVEKIKSKLSQFTYSLRELKKSTDIKTATTAYYAYAYAWLNYGTILWGNSVDVHDILVLQKKCIRILANIQNNETCKPYFKTLKILTQPCIYILELCKFVRKNNQLYTKLGDMPRRYESRSKNNLFQVTSKLKLHSSGPFPMSIQIYNKLPENFKCELNYNKFKNNVKKFLIEKAYYSVREYLEDKLN